MTLTIEESIGPCERKLAFVVFLESPGERTRQVADGKPGPIAQRLRAGFRKYVEQNHFGR